MQAWEVLADILATPFGLIFIILLSRLRYSYRASFIGFCAVVLAFTTLNFLLVRNMKALVESRPYLDFVFRFFNMGIVAAIVFIFTRQRLSRTVFTVLFACVCILIIETITIALNMFAGTPKIVPELFLYTAMVLLTLKGRNAFLEVAENLKKEDWWPLSLMLGIIVVNFFVLISIPVPLEKAPGNMPAALVLCLTSGIVFVTFALLFLRMRRQSRLEQDALFMQLYVQALEKQNDLAAKNAEHIRILKHDMRHYTQMILTQADLGDLDAIRDIVSSLDQRLEEGDQQAILNITGCRVIDAALSHHIIRARDMGIEVRVGLGAMNLPHVDKTELAVVLSNAMENAVRSCEKLPCGKGYIGLTGRQMGQQYFLQMENNYEDAPKFDMAGTLPVSDKPGHGIGSKSIQFFAKKYGGSLTYEAGEGLFKLRLLV